MYTQKWEKSKSDQLHSFPKRAFCSCSHTYYCTCWNAQHCWLSSVHGSVQFCFVHFCNSYKTWSHSWSIFGYYWVVVFVGFCWIIGSISSCVAHNCGQYWAVTLLPHGWINIVSYIVVINTDQSHYSHIVGFPLEWILEFLWQSNKSMCILIW